MEENLCRVVRGAIEGILFTADDARVPQAAEIHAELARVVVTNQFIKDLTYTVDGLRLQDDICGCVIFLKDITTEGTNR